MGVDIRFNIIRIVMKRKVAVFDFDGTLTTKDTLLEFIKFACGKPSFYWGIFLHIPIFILMKMNMYPNWKAKERFFSHFFKGVLYDWFKEKGEAFSDVIEKFIKYETQENLIHHLERGDSVYVVSASVEEWVRPWCKKRGAVSVLSTKAEVDDKGKLTGCFLNRNCYGQEKVNRLLEVEPNRDEYFLYAYGDSRGDKEMIEFADYGKYIK